MKKFIPPDFIIVPYQLIIDDKITPIDRDVYGLVYWLTKLKGERCIASNLFIAQALHISAKSVQNSLTRLQQYGYIHRTFKDESRRVREEIIPLIVLSKVSLNKDTGIPNQGYDVSLNKEQKKKRVIRKVNNTAKHCFAGKEINDLISLFEEVNPTFERLYGNKTQRAALERLVAKFGQGKISGAIKALHGIINQKYAPRITTPLQLEQKLGDLAAFVKQQKVAQNSVIGIAI